ncbi:MAG: hypothetical protein HOV68_28705, partial [Streptomycetaceae bacterium]|nr:hypothetical protein [Streptomycetaceae bacterium]
MKLAISIEHADREGELRSLHAWLAADDRLAATAPDLVASRAVRDGEMGPVLDILQLVLGSSIGAADLALGIAAWRRSRAEPPTLEIGHGGVTITLRGAGDDDLRRLVAFLEAGGDGDGGDEDGGGDDARHGAN